ncbi:carbonic anhydrase 1 [Drosophila guanche]|uniref:Blast:Carbonic anhydrase 15 n=1 Tax=Drosophila guanche TaxID=7266 RepID=A0A3B0J3G0_DROGU|nr:carbonic anhydrase 1 [Drosophila guanche]SPP73793.1 blast:Carbonic anhydrase 15 [Drosophila guanche]
MLASIYDFWLQFMQGFSFVMRYTERSKLLRVLVCCVLSMAILNIVWPLFCVIKAVTKYIVTWRLKMKLARQPTPISIVRSATRRTMLGSPLVWHYYDKLPIAMLLENNGSTVILRISCKWHSMPHLSGGGLAGKYHFVEACFKWGAEHSIDAQKFSLEMQVLHRCHQGSVPFECVAVSYLFAHGHGHGHGHGPLNQITESLRCVAHPNSHMELPPFDLASLMSPFGSSFYRYEGTYDNGGQVLPTLWLICSEIFAISAVQSSQFRALHGIDGKRINWNARPEQPLGNRCLSFYTF